LRDTFGKNPFFHLLDSSLSRLVPAEPVEAFGEWSATRRKLRRSEKRNGIEVGRFVEVIDRRWQGTLSCRSNAGAMAFLLTPRKIYWAKTPKIALSLPVEVSLHAYAVHGGGRVTFAARTAGAFLPGVPVAAPASLDDVCARGTMTFNLGRVFTLARADSAAFVVVALPSTVLRMGRNHLWRLRDEIASSLAPDMSELLTRRRSGEFDTGRVWNGS